MKNLFLVISAIILFSILCPLGVAYTASYYAAFEKDKGFHYTYRCALVVDIAANVAFGELFERYLAVERGVTLFGSITTLSAATGEIIINGNANARCMRFSRVLDWIFGQKDHCVNAYYKSLK